MNGAILGMTKQEINGKLDEIIDFSGCERYIDTPVKRYSSGMMVRLGFAVAAHLEPEILVVDEVLAVGDAEFQKKAIGKMQDVSKGQGRTVLFVSHNMGSIRALCKHGVLLKDGMVDYTGEVNDVVDRYILEYSLGNSNHCITTDKNRGSHLPKDLEIVEVFMKNDVNAVATDDALQFELRIKCNNNRVKQFNIGMLISNAAMVNVGTSVSPLLSCTGSDIMTVEMTVKGHNLAKGHYDVDFTVGLTDVSVGTRYYDVVEKVLAFDVEYKTRKGLEPYSLWPSIWGSHHLSSIDYSVR